MQSQICHTDEQFYEQRQIVLFDSLLFRGLVIQKDDNVS